MSSSVYLFFFFHLACFCLFVSLSPLFPYSSSCCCSCQLSSSMRNSLSCLPTASPNVCIRSYVCRSTIFSPHPLSKSVHLLSGSSREIPPLSSVDELTLQTMRSSLKLRPQCVCWQDLFISAPIHTVPLDFDWDHNELAKTPEAFSLINMKICNVDDDGASSDIDFRSSHVMNTCSIRVFSLCACGHAQLDCFSVCFSSF